MKKLKYIMVILAIAIIIILIVLVTLNKNGGSNSIDEDIITDMEYEAANENYTKIEDITEYINVKKCVSSYFSNINIESSVYYGRDDDGNYTKISTDQEINANIINVLSNEYINKNSITTDNVRNYVYKIEDNCFFIPIEILDKGNTENVKSFGVYGLVETQDFSPLMECYLIINIDSNNNTYSVEQLASKEEVNTADIEVPNEIDKNDNNGYTESMYIEEELIKAYINNFKRLALAYPEILYNDFLDEEYREKRFGDLETFKAYISKNKNQIISVNPKQYNITEYENYTQYYAIDQNGKYYIFNVTTPTDYSVILDIYTVDLPQFTEKYETATDQQKVALNIDKFMQAINAGDYKYAYNCLADSFKNNYFKTQEEFETYAKENFYESNTVAYGDFNTQGDVYTYSVTLTNSETEEQTSKTFIVQLGEGTNFVLSFNR